MNEDNGAYKEIIIVKRRAPLDDEEHHGGVWKIAFADFMTAMMAFFLVLWIVNSTSKETQAAIARHFNPMKITDTSPAPKGLKDPIGTDFDATLKDDTKEVPRRLAEAAGSGISARDQSFKDASLEGRLFVEPEKVLSEIVEQHREDVSMRGTRADPPVGFRDPFLDLRGGFQESDSAIETTSRGPSISRSTKDAHTPGVASASRSAVAESRIQVQRQELSDAIIALGAHSIPKITVAEVTDGILISLSDTDGFSMFRSGSAKPEARTIEIIDRIAARIVGMSGSLVVRGHTDSRAFRSNVSDNWRLSSARAQVTYFILRRAGIPEHRFARLEGHADHQLARKDDPFSALNRRIEILLQVGK